MREDMRQINKDEERIQRELMQLHQKNLGKHAKILQKYKIDSGLKSTEELLRKMLCIPATTNQNERKALHEQRSASNKRPEEFTRMKPDAQESQLADKLMDSLENLDKILANIRLGRKEECLEQLARKFQIWPEESEE